MDNAQERQINQASYRRLREWINKNYAAGRYLAISGGQIVADATDFDALQSVLSAMGKNPTEALIVQAGVDYPETAVIFVQLTQS